MNAQLQPFIIVDASCGYVTTQIVSAKSRIDVMRSILLSDYTNPNSEYFLRDSGLNSGEFLLAAIIGAWSNKEPDEKLTPDDAMPFIDAQGHTNEELIASLPDSAVETLFEYAFSGGEGEQCGNPGKEWVTITVEPLPTSFPSIYDKYNPAKHDHPSLKKIFNKLDE